MIYPSIAQCPPHIWKVETSGPIHWIAPSLLQSSSKSNFLICISYLDFDPVRLPGKAWRRNRFEFRELLCGRCTKFHEGLLSADLHKMVTNLSAHCVNASPGNLSNSFNRDVGINPTIPVTYYLKLQVSTSHSIETYQSR